MAKMYWEEDANPKALAGKRIAILGYGSQGRAQALNLRDSGFTVVVGLRRGGESWKQAVADGWQPFEPAGAVESADVVSVLVPDMVQAKLYREAIAPNLKKGAMLHFSHGLSIHYGQIQHPLDVDVAMVAPKGPGDLVRRQFEEGRGVPCLLAVHQDASGVAFERTLAYAHGLGGTRAGVIATTFAEETETDHFGEQAVLCGGVTELILAGWETLVGAGYQPEIAYFECLHELKLIVDLIYEGGFTRMQQFVSDTAKYADVTRGPMVIDQHVRNTMKQILETIRSGAFANEWIREYEAGCPEFHRLLDRDRNHPLESVGRELRAKMAWLNKRQKAHA